MTTPTVSSKHRRRRGLTRIVTTVIAAIAALGGVPTATASTASSVPVYSPYDGAQAGIRAVTTVDQPTLFTGVQHFDGLVPADGDVTAIPTVHRAAAEIVADGVVEYIPAPGFTGVDRVHLTYPGGYDWDAALYSVEVAVNEPTELANPSPMPADTVTYYADETDGWVKPRGVV